MVALPRRIHPACLVWGMALALLVQAIPAAAQVRVFGPPGGRFPRPFPGGPVPGRPSGYGPGAGAPAAPFTLQEPAAETVEGGAVIALLNLDRSAIGTLVEAKLRGKKIVNWWPRGATTRLLDDLELAAASDIPPAAAATEKPGLPDAVIFCRTHARGEERIAQVVVVEPGLGLRLGSVHKTLTKDAAGDVGKLTTALTKILGKLGQPMQELWGIPAFQSQDLGFKYDDLRQQFPRVVEEELLRRKGAFLVEIEEAHAIALIRQHAGVSDAVRRPTPIYLEGEFRNNGEGAQRTVSITLQVSGEDADSAEPLSPMGLPPEEAEKSLRDKARQIAKQRGGSQEIEETDTAAELNQLAGSAKKHATAGDIAGQLALLETTLLLQPDNPAVATESIRLLGQRTEKLWQRGRDLAVTRLVVETLPGGGTNTKSVPNEQLPELMQDGLAAMNLYRRGLRRLSVWLAAPPNVQSQSVFHPESFLVVFQGVSSRPDIPRHYLVAAQRLSQQQQVVGMQWIRREALEGRGNVVIQWGESTFQERMSLILRLIVELQDYPQPEQRVMAYVLSSLGPPGLKTPEGEAFLAQLATMDHPGVKSAVAKIQDIVDKYEVPKPMPPMPEPSEAEITDADVKFVPLSLDWKGLPPGLPALKAYCDLVIPAGKEVDLFCREGQILLMKKKGEAKLIYDAQSPGYSFKHFGGQGMAPAYACYDGRYVWLPMMAFGKPSRLLVVDVETEKVTEITAEDGLPSDVPEQNLSPSIVAAPLSPGKVMLAGFFGKTWIGIGEFDGDKVKSVKVVHEARDLAIPLDREQWRKTTLAFSPAYIFTLTEKRKGKDPPSQRVVIGRASGAGDAFSHPLLVDPTSGKVEVVQDGFNPGQVNCLAQHDGSLYWVQHSAGNQLENAEFMRLGFPDFKPESLGKQPLPGKSYSLALGMDETATHVFHEQWLTAEAPGEPLRVLKGNLPKNERTSPRHLLRSNHYGWVVMVLNFQKGYSVEFPNAAAESEKPPADKK